MIDRHLAKQIAKRLDDKKAILLLGPRQVGKSTLLQLLSSKFNKPVVWWDGDESDIRAMLQQPTSSKIKAYIGSNKTVVIDEAQRIENIGVCLKLITDKLKEVKVIATGSSSFELANKINEPLTGRKWQFNLFPLSFGEMVQHTSLLEEQRLLEHRLIFGYYPEIVSSAGDEAKRLKELAESYLYKDILIWGRIQKPDKLEKLVQALSFQVAQLYSNYELGQLCGLNSETVESYIQLLEKAFVIFRLPAYNRNQRNELKKSYKIFFYDNGLRNAVINQFSSVALRNDVGQLWENWFVSERIKYLNNSQKNASSFFWRTTAQQEVDYIESENGILSAFECKWSVKSNGKITRAFINAYPEAATQVVTPENAFKFLL
ncbi:MAG: ATP-binding protein [Bacteroidetes bacterium]|jgi:predicted AAA+ superfamily ATPase|nr:ATP-binding protein [Bacteroidota bacterium]